MRQINPQFEGHNLVFCIKYDLPYILGSNITQWHSSNIFCPQWKQYWLWIYSSDECFFHNWAV